MHSIQPLYVTKISVPQPRASVPNCVTSCPSASYSADIIYYQTTRMVSAPVFLHLFIQNCSSCGRKIRSNSDPNNTSMFIINESTVTQKKKLSIFPCKNHLKSGTICTVHDCTQSYYNVCNTTLPWPGPVLMTSYLRSFRNLSRSRFSGVREPVILLTLWSYQSYF